MADKVVIEARDDGEKMRADLFLSRELARILGAEISRERIKSLFQAACVFQNGLSLKPSSKVKPGEVEIRLPLRKLKEIATTKGNALSIEPVNIPLDVLYEDGELVVINKRAGMSVHPSPSDFDPTVAAALMHKYGVTISEADFERALTLRRGAPGADDGGEDGDDLAGGGDAPEPSYIDAIESLKSALLAKNIGIVHRLDKMTSGCLAVARSVHAYEFMAERFAAREVEKEYLAITAGTPPSETGLIDAPIIRNPQGRTKYTALAFGERRGRDASTEYCVAAAAYGLAVLRLNSKMSFSLGGFATE